jgi:hypothetical protein
MSEFHDPDLRHELGRLSGPYPDDNIAFAAWQRRIGQVQRRRIVAWTSAAALSLVLGTIGVAALQSPGRHSIVPSKAGETSTEVTVSIATIAHTASTTESARPELSQVTTLPVDTTPTIEAVEPSVADTEASASGEQPATPSSKVPSTKPSSGSQSAMKTFHSIGGSIIVRRDGDRLTLVTETPAAGFHAHHDDESHSQIDVSFKSDGHESEIIVKLEDGVMKPDISEKPDSHSDNHETTVPDSSGGHHGDGGHGG